MFAKWSYLRTAQTALKQPMSNQRLSADCGNHSPPKQTRSFPLDIHYKSKTLPIVCLKQTIHISNTNEFLGKITKNTMIVGICCWGTQRTHRTQRTRRAQRTQRTQRTQQPPMRRSFPAEPLMGRPCPSPPKKSVTHGILCHVVSGVPCFLVGQ